MSNAEIADYLNNFKEKLEAIILKQEGVEFIYPQNKSTLKGVQVRNEMLSNEKQNEKRLGLN